MQGIKNIIAKIKGNKQHKVRPLDRRISDVSALEISAPADFSFKKLTKLESVDVEGPRSTRVGRVPERGPETRKYMTKSIWLNNNKLTSIENIDVLVNSLLEQPEKLGWIDFSFNSITKLDDSLLKFPNLKIIYFHGNQLKDLEEVFRLRPLRKLRSITFHGNPLADHPNYRMSTVTYLPQIVNLDFSPVTNCERRQPKPPDAVRRISVYDIVED